MATQVKINTDKVTVKQQFNGVVRAANKLNETSIMYGPKKCKLSTGFIAGSSEFLVPNQFRDRVSLKQGLPNMKS